MNLKHDPFPLIFTRGDPTTRLACLEFFDLMDSPQASHALLELLGDKRYDGAFPGQLDREVWGMRETIRNALLLLKLKMPPADSSVASTVDFVLCQQRLDGGWSENPSLEIPPQQTWMSNERSITWLTADAVELLRQVGLGNGHECQAAVEWLRAMQTPKGGWPSLGGEVDGRQVVIADSDSTAQVTFLMRELYGDDDPAYLKGLERFESYIDDCARDVERGYRVRLSDRQREKLDVYHLTHLLLSWVLDPPRRFQSGYDATDPRVRHMMDTLAEIQGADGGWQPFFAEESSPVYTVLAVKALVLSGMIAWEDMSAAAEAHAL